MSVTNEEMWIGVVQRELNKYTHLRRDTSIKLPSIEIFENKTAWGYYIPNLNVMGINIELLRNYSIGALKHVVAHELAHYLVHAIWHINDATSHGDTFKLACKNVGIEPSYSDSKLYLDAFKPNSNDYMLTKIKKLIDHSNDDAVTIEESKLFASKARKLMIKHGISQYDNTDRQMTIRPIGQLYKRMPLYMTILSNNIANAYNVKTISTYVYNERGTFKVIHLFGDIDKLDIAEYMFYAILNQARAQWELFKKSTSFNHRLHNISNFMRGIIHSYFDTINRDIKDELNEADDIGKAIILGDDPILNDKYAKCYPNAKTSISRTHVGGGYKVGYTKGSNIKVGKACGVSGNSVKYLS